MILKTGSSGGRVDLNKSNKISGFPGDASRQGEQADRYQEGSGSEA